jgi:hypothetical protein
MCVMHTLSRQAERPELPAENRPHRPGPDQPLGVDGDHVFGRDEVEQVEDRPVLGEQQEVDVLPADAARGRAERLLGEHGRTHLG